MTASRPPFTDPGSSNHERSWRFRPASLADALRRDVVSAVRSIGRQPAFATAAVLTIALAVGVAASLFTVVNELVLRPVPGVRAPGLVKLYVTRDGALEGLSGHSYPTFRDYADRSQSIRRAGALAGGGFAVSVEGSASLVLGTFVSGDLFATLGTRPSAGRLIGREDERSRADVAVLSHAYWVDRLGSRPDILGRPLRVNGHSLTVVGVAEEGFRGPFIGFPSDVFVPLSLAGRLSGRIDLVDRRSDALEVYAQLGAGVPLAQAQADLDRVTSDLSREFPDTFRRRGVRVLPWHGLDADLATPVLGFVGVLAGIGALVVVLASVNVAGLLLHRGQSRRTELAVRQALGAGRATLVRQLAVETFLLFAVGQATGSLLAAWATGWLHAFLPDFAIPIRLDLTVDWRVWLLTSVVTLATAIVFGVLPAATSTDVDPAAVLRPSVAGTPRQLRLRQALVAAQVAVALVLLVTAGLFVRTLWRAATLETGVQAAGVSLATADVTVVSQSEQEGRAFFEAWLDAGRRQPGVGSAALSSSPPFQFGRVTTPVTIDGRDPDEGAVAAARNIVTGGYFETLGVALLAGRTFELVDAPQAEPVTIVSRTMARRLFGSLDALGRYLVDVDLQTRRRIVGVVEDVAQYRPGDVETAVFYEPFSQRYTPRLSLVARGQDVVLPEVLRQVAREIHPDVPVLTAESLDGRREAVLFPQRMAASLAGVLGLVGLGLAVVGLYGVVAFHATARRREMAVRVALGAGRDDVRRLVVATGVRPVVLGVLAGVPLAGWLAGAMRAFLPGISAWDPVAMGAASAVLVVTATAAVALPARRAGRLDPMQTLRME